LSRELTEYLSSRIRKTGPVTFHDYMEEVLYHPRFGYYSSDRNLIGGEGDFFTSADLDPIFGRIVAETLKEMATSLESFTVVELGAGKGLLARDILDHHRFPYVIVERSAAMRRRQQQALKGLDVEWANELPQGLVGCVFSNEFFDAQPVHKIVRRGSTLKEVYVTEQFSECEGPLTATPLIDCLEFMQDGQVVDISLEARRWIRRIAASLRAGYHFAIDYGYLRRDFFAHPHGTLMCYWRHQATEDPYIRIGEQDITAHVNFSDLMEAGAEAGMSVVSFNKQMDFLIQAGILDEMQKLAAGDAGSIKRLLKIKRLILPGSMGERFKVLIQSKGICATSHERPMPLPQRDPD
jgi:SAM-dependent MidA family methyltransferase